MQTAKPSVIELVQTLSQFMQQQLAPQLTGAVAYNTRIALNVLAMIERELTLGESLEQAEIQRLSQLLGETGDKLELNKQLIGKIQKEELDYSSQALMDHLYQTALGKLAIDNPRYASYQKVCSEKSLS